MGRNTLGCAEIKAGAWHSTMLMRIQCMRHSENNNQGEDAGQEYKTLLRTKNHLCSRTFLIFSEK